MFCLTFKEVDVMNFFYPVRKPRHSCLSLPVRQAGAERYGGDNIINLQFVTERVGLKPRPVRNFSKIPLEIHSPPRGVSGIRSGRFISNGSHPF
jgi:hypothetical protein